MWQYIVGVLAALVLGGLYWLMKPYFVWKRSAKNANHTGEKLVIWNTQSQSSSLSEHLQRGVNSKVDISLVVPSYNEE